jgi:hypothetical protein
MSKHLAEDDSENEGPSDYSPTGSWRSRSPSCSSAADSPSPEFRFSARPVSRLATDQGRIVIREEPERPNPTPATKLTGDVLLESLLEEHLSPEKLVCPVQDAKGTHGGGSLEPLTMTACFLALDPSSSIDSFKSPTNPRWSRSPSCRCESTH